MSTLPKKPLEFQVGHAPYRLKEEILALSVADVWPEAKREWVLDHIYLMGDKQGTCLCGHTPIVECCVLVNQANGNQAVVGNVCVTKFLGLDSEAVFRSLRGVLSNPERAFNRSVLDYAVGRGWLTEFERNFYQDTQGKPRNRLSPRQLVTRREVNAKVLRLVGEEGQQCRR